MAVKVGNVVVNFITNTAAFESDIKKISRTLKSTGRDFTAAGQSLTKHLTLPMVAFGVAMGKLALGIDQGLDTIRAGTGKTGKALEGLGKSMRAVMKQVPQDVSQVSTAIADLNTRLGLSGKPLEEMSRQMLNLARVGKADIGAVVAASTRLFGDWSVATDKQSKSLDYMFKVSRSTGIGIQQLMELTVQYGAPLRALGFNLEQAAAMMGKWEKEGVNMETALAGLRYGLKEFAKAGKDPVAALSNMITKIKETKSSTEQTNLAMKTFGQRAGVDIGRAIVEGRFDLDDLIKTLKASSETINKAAADTMSFSEKLQQFRNRVALAAEPLGNALLRALEGLMPFLEKGLGLLAKMGEAFAALPQVVQLGVIGITGMTAAMGPLLWAFGSMSTGIAALLPMFTRMSLAITGAGGLLGAVKLLGAAALVTGAIFAGWKIAEWIDGLDLFGRHAKVAANEIYKQAEAFRKEAVEIGAVKEAMAKYQKMLDDGIIGQTTFNSVLGDLTQQRGTETLEQYRNRMKGLVDQFKAAHPEMSKTKEAAAAAIPTITDLGLAFKGLDEYVISANDKLAAFNESIWFMIENAANLPKALDLNVGKTLENLGNQADFIFNDVLNKQNIQSSLDAINDANFSGLMEAARAGFDLDPVHLWIDETERAGETINDFGRTVSTTLTNATQEWARAATEWMGPIKGFARAALSALMEGLFNPLFKVLTSVGNAIGNWLGGLFGGGGGGLSLGGAMKSALGLGGNVALGAGAGAMFGGGTSAGLTAYASSLGVSSGAGAAAASSGTAAGSAAGLGGFASGVGAALSAAGSAIATGATAVTAALGMALSASVAIPVVGGLIVGGIVGGMKLADWASGPNSYEAAAKEVKRDYGMNMSAKQIQAFFNSMGISESKAWGQRWPLLKSPQFQSYALAIGQQADFSKQSTAYQSAYQSGMGGNWGNYNELFLDEFANKYPKAITDFPDWYDKLTIPNQSGMSAQEQTGPRTVTVRGGDVYLTVPISGNTKKEDIRSVFNEMLPLIKEAALGGPTGLREVLDKSRRITQGAY